MNPTLQHTDLEGGRPVSEGKPQRPLNSLSREATEPKLKEKGGNPATPHRYSLRDVDSGIDAFTESSFSASFQNVKQDGYGLSPDSEMFDYAGEPVTDDHCGRTEFCLAGKVDATGVSVNVVTNAHPPVKHLLKHLEHPAAPAGGEAAGGQQGGSAAGRPNPTSG